MLRKLEKYYESNGILATTFTCEHKKSCRDSCTSFTGPKSAFVSDGYAKRLLPRVLFLSLDSGSAFRAANKRTPTAVRTQEEARNIGALPKNRHWYRTHELAWYFLKEFMPNLQQEDTKNFIAHTNAAKCCLNKERRAKADRRLFENCRPYLKQELKILDPDIVVTQGNEAKLAMECMITGTLQRFDDFAAVISLNDNEVFWLHTYHPRKWGKFNQQRNPNGTTGATLGWKAYATQAKSFLVDAGQAIFSDSRAT